MDEYRLPAKHPFHSAWRGPYQYSIMGDMRNGNYDCKYKPDNFPPAEGVTAIAIKRLETALSKPWTYHKGFDFPVWRPDDMPSKKGNPKILAKLLAELRREENAYSTVHGE